MNIGQPKIAALILVGQLFVINSQQMQNRRVQVMHMDWIANNVVIVVVGFSERQSTLHASPCHEYRKTTRMMIAPVVFRRQIAL